jgi:hypothetical protein
MNDTTEGAQNCQDKGSYSKKGTQINKKRGYILETDIMRGLELIPSILPYKIPDAKTMGVMTRCKVPADFVISVRGRGLYTIEAKTTKCENRITGIPEIKWANFKEHQLQWSLHSPSSALFIINFNNRKKGHGKVDRTFILTGFDMAKLIAGHKSVVPITSIAALGVEVYRKTAKHHPDGTSAFIDFEGVVW